MIKIKIDKLLKSKDKNPFWLSMQTGIASQNIYNLVNGKTAMLRFDTLSKLCAALDCQVGDLLEYIPDPPTNEPPDIYKILEDATPEERAKILAELQTKYDIK